MAQSAVVEINDVSASDDADHHEPVLSGKRKRDMSDGGEAETNGFIKEKPSASGNLPKRNVKEVIRLYYEVLRR